MESRIKPLYEIQGDTLIINLHPGQHRTFDSKARFVFMLAGTQGGKTEFGPIWMYREMQQKGPGDYLAVSPSFPLQQKKLIPSYRNFFEYTLKIGEFLKGERVMTIHDLDGSEYKLFFGSADNPDSLESATAKAAHLDEIGQDSFRLESWEAVLRRLSIHQGRVLGTTTLYNLGWLKHEVYDRWERRDPNYDVVQFDSIENPVFPRDEYERAKNTLPAWKFDLFYRGRYARPAGMIYSDYDEKVHLIPPFELPVEFPRYVGIDPGAVHTALIWIAEDIQKKAYYIYHSSLEGGKTTKEHASKAAQFAKTERVIKWTGGAKSEEQFRMDWRAEGINVQEPPVSDVEMGIDRVIALFKQYQLFIFNNDENRGLLDELGTYSRELDELGNPTEKIKDKEKFHILDALRYCCSSLKDGGNPITIMITEQEKPVISDEMRELRELDPELFED